MTISLATKGVITPKYKSFNEGEIEIEPNRWQMVAIPAQFGYFDVTDSEIKSSSSVIATIYNYVVLQLETIYNDDIENLIEVINAYVGEKNYFFNYIPGFTPESSEHNFQLIYSDDHMLEITPFWVKSKVNYNMIIKWRS